MKLAICLVLVSIIHLLEAQKLTEKSRVSNLTELLDAFSDGLGDAIKPNGSSTTSLADRLLMIKSRIEAYGALEEAVREDLMLDDFNRIVTYSVLGTNLALSSWANYALADISLLTATLSLANAILAQVSASFGLATGIIASIITLETTLPPLGSNSSATSRLLLARSVQRLSTHPSFLALRDGRILNFLSFLSKALKMAAEGAEGARA